MLCVAGRSVRAHLGRLSLSMVGAAVAVAFVLSTNIITSTLGQSFDEMFANVYGRIDVVVQGRFGGNGTVDAAFGGAHSVVDESVVGRVGSVEGVRVAAGQVQQPIAVLGSDGRVLNANGVPPTFGMNWLEEPELNGWRIVDGAAPTEGGAVIDRRLAGTLGVRAGGSIRVVAQDGSVRSLRVWGVATFGGDDSYAGSSAVVMETAAAQRLFLEPGTFNWVSAAGEPGITQADLAARVRPAVPRDTKTYTGAQFTKQAQQTFGGYVELLSRFLLAFAYVAAAVGAFSIFNTFSILVAQRQRELALLRALGASRRQVLGSVLLEAAMVGLLTGAGGVLLGVGGAALFRTILVRFGVVLPAVGLQVSAGMVLAAIGLALTGTLAAAVLPSWRAARVRPLAALRELSTVEVPATRGRVIAGGLMVAYGVWSIRRGLSTPQLNAVAVAGGGLAAAFVGVSVLSPLFWARMARWSTFPMARLGGFVGLLAGRNSARHPVRTARVGAALISGVGLVTMFAVMTSSLAGASAEIVRRGTRSDLVINSDVGRGGTIDPAVEDRVRSLPSVSQVAGARFTYTEVDNNSGLAIGVDPAMLDKVFDLRVVEGSLDGLSGAGVAVERKVARAKGWTVGSKVTGEFVQAGYEPLEIVALVDGQLPFSGVNVFKAVPDFDRRVPPAQRGDSVLYVQTSPGGTSEAARAEVGAAIADRPLLQVRTLEQYAGAGLAAAESFVNVVSGLLFIALLVAFIGVGNSLMLSVLERVREIGLLRAVGMHRRQVRRMVEWEGFQLGLAGASLGLGLGLGAGWVLTRAIGTELAVQIPWMRLLLTVALATALAVVAAIPPAHRAARLPILKTLGA
ncbi:MAG: FtsX-like permease family protein [Actinobacteria bacterium]|nr:FtsX-like permease family protein [Actinomycetota bacterium]